MHETFASLLTDPAHWEFELLVGFIEMVVFDLIIGALIGPFVYKHWKHHVARDRDEVFGRGLSASAIAAQTAKHSSWAAELLGGERMPEYTDWSSSSPLHVKPGTVMFSGTVDGETAETWPEPFAVDIPVAGDICGQCKGSVVDNNDQVRCTGCGTIYNLDAQKIAEPPCTK